MLERADRALALRPRQENNSRCRLHMKRIQFASAEAVEKVGVDIAIVDGAADRRGDRGQRRDWLRPDADGASCQPRAGHGLARREAGRRPRGEGRRAGADRCGRSGPGQERVAAGDRAVAARSRTTSSGCGRWPAMRFRRGSFWKCEAEAEAGADSHASGAAGAGESGSAGRGR